MQKLLQLINDLETKILFRDKINQEVSKSSVGWHIEHCIIVISKTISGLQKSNQRDYKWEFNFKKSIVFSLKKIPRGKVNAPSTVLPTAALTQKYLTQNISNTKLKIASLNALSAKNFIQHPLFKKLNKKDTITFLNIHTKHHINIINDIIKSTST